MGSFKTCDFFSTADGFGFDRLSRFIKVSIFSIKRTTNPIPPNRLKFFPNMSHKVSVRGFYDFPRKICPNSLERTEAFRSGSSRLVLHFAKNPVFFDGKRL